MGRIGDRIGQGRLRGPDSETRAFDGLREPDQRSCRAQRSSTVLSPTMIRSARISAVPSRRG
jgi:hypothetical protein